MIKMAEEQRDYALYLSTQAQSDTSALHEFRLLYSENDDSVHLFFEGADDPAFYMPEIRPRAKNRALRVYNCGGKPNVNNVRRSITEDGYNVEGCLFFVDRDFDSYLGQQMDPDDRTYITDNYAIENDIATLAAAEIILVDILSMSATDPDRNETLQAVCRALDGFASLMRPLMAWCLAARENGHSLNLSNANFSKMFVVDHQGCVKKRGKLLPLFRRQVAKGNVAVPLSAILRWRRNLVDQDRKRWLRGKYELWIFETILLLALADIANKRKASGGKKLRIPSALRERCLFDLLGARVPKPDSLLSFLELALVAA